MNQIDIYVHAEGRADPILVKIAEEAIIADLLKAAEEAGVILGEQGEDVFLLIEGEVKIAKPEHKLHHHGIGHGHHVHVHRRDVEITVNTRKKKWAKEEISYQEVVILAFGAYSDDPRVVYTVDFSNGPKHHREGSLVKGQLEKVKCGMIFDVTQTDNS